MTLISTNPDCENIVFSQAKQKLGKNIILFFENEQWWVVKETITEQMDEQEIYSVIDIDGGVDFEMI